MKRKTNILTQAMATVLARQIIEEKRKAANADMEEVEKLFAKHPAAKKLTKLIKEAKLLTEALRDFLANDHPDYNFDYSIDEDVNISRRTSISCMYLEKELAANLMLEMNIKGKSLEEAKAFVLAE